MWAATQKNTHGGVSYILKAALSGNNGCKTKNTHKGCFLCFGGATRNRTGDEGFADPCLTAWLWRRMELLVYYSRGNDVCQEVFRDFEKIFRRSAGLSCAHEKGERGGKGEENCRAEKGCGGDTQPPERRAKIQHAKQERERRKAPCRDGKQHQEERHHNACCRRADGFVGAAACLTQTRQFGAGYQREYGAD